MPSPIVSHLIGTTMLLVIMLVVSYYFTNFGTIIGVKAVEKELNEVAEYIASNIIDMVSLANASLSDTLLLEIDFPYEINGYGYSINITKESDHYIVITRTEHTSIVEGKAILPFSSQIIYSSLNPGINGIEGKNGLYSGTRKALIWCKKVGTEIYFGFGVRE